MTKVLLNRVVYFYGYAFRSWHELDDKQDRITGKWRIIDGDVSIEIEHGHWESSFFRKRWVTDTKWYDSETVLFIQEFNCAT